MNSWQVGDVKISCVVEFKTVTHLHIDHIGWNTFQEDGRWVPTFPRARYLMSRREYEFWVQDQDDEQIAAMGDDKPVLVVGTHFVEPAGGYIRTDEEFAYRFAGVPSVDTHRPGRQASLKIII